MPGTEAFQSHEERQELVGVNFLKSRNWGAVSADLQGTSIRGIAMTWDWKRFDENSADLRVERQMHEYGCGAACAVMLLRDRGIQADQLVLAAGLRLPSTAKELAERLNQFSGVQYSWSGGHLDLDAPPSSALVRYLCSHGSWAALLIPVGGTTGTGWLSTDSTTRSWRSEIPLGQAIESPIWNLLT